MINEEFILKSVHKTGHTRYFTGTPVIIRNFKAAVLQNILKNHYMWLQIFQNISSIYIIVVRN